MASRANNWKRAIALVAAMGIVALSLACFPAKAWAARKSSITTQKALAYAIRQNNGGTVTLEGDIELTSPLTITEKITIDLNGYVLSGILTGKNIRITTGELTLTDSNPSRQHADPSLPEGGVFAGDYLGPNGCGVWCGGAGEFTLAGGTIHGFDGYRRGGAVYVASGGTFNMTGGTISDCKVSDVASNWVTYVGAVYMENGGMFNKSGGTITDCGVVTTDDYLEDAEDEPDVSASIVVSTPIVVPPVLADGTS